MKTNDTKYQAPALDKGLDIMEYLSLKAKPLSQTDIAAGIGKKPNEIYRMLVCLESRGYLIREEVSGKYKLSLKLYHLSHRHSPVDEVRRAAQHPMDELASTIHQSCHLGVLYLEQLMVISQSRSPGPIALSVEEGRLFPLLMTTSGRVLLAFMQEEERLRLLRGNNHLPARTVNNKR
ncbi:MAG TPA: helix-turn-helix domain-containing protein, partial [Anseongella sp.]|nr:helix-turn-helix domain-containing protein [Anseongella sp.]